MAGTAHYALKVLEVFRYFFHGRCSGIIRALTTDFGELYRQCDPEKDAQSLVGLPNGTWEVRPPQMTVPHDLPEPALGINFARDMLFQMINELPTVRETVKGFGKSNEKSCVTMLKKPESCSTVHMSSPHKDEIDLCGSSSYGQNKSSAT